MTRMRKTPESIKQTTIYDDPVTVVAWRRAAASRASYLAAPTKRMLEQAHIAPGHRVLVVGAGTGEEALDAASLVGAKGEVVATDASAAMIAEASRSLEAANVTNIRCLVMDAQSLDFGKHIRRSYLAQCRDVHSQSRAGSGGEEPSLESGRTSCHNHVGLRSPEPATLGPTPCSAGVGRQAAADGKLPGCSSPRRSPVAHNGSARSAFLRRGGPAVTGRCAVRQPARGSSASDGPRRNARARQIAFRRLRRADDGFAEPALEKVRHS
jgi:hypothetical protein